jgi:MFS family permease
MTMAVRTSIWSSLRNPTYLRLWSALIASGCCVSAHEMAATWAMNSLRAPAIWLSLMSSAATLPFFLFTLPAGALADLADRRQLMRICNGWLAGSAALMAGCGFLGGLNREFILAGVFLLGSGFAFLAPVASASIPEIVGKEQLPSAIALGGIQLNLAGIIGPALGGLLIPFVGVNAVFAFNAMAFLLVLVAVSSWKRKNVAVEAPLEGLLDSLAGALRYMRYAPGVRVVLLRNLIFGVLIGATPALLPVIGLKTLHLDPLKFGLVYTSMGLGSLAGAILILEPARKRLSPNQMTILGGIVLAFGYALMAMVRQPQVFLVVAALAGAAWTISASELWVAGQRVIPDWIRGRMNATHMMVSQGGLSLAGIVWGGLATELGVQWALFSASALAILSAVTARRWSIDFSADINLEPHPLAEEHQEAYLPDTDDGPITTTLEIEVAPENHIRFFRLMKQIRLVFLRNGAFSARLDQDMANPNRFRLQAMVSSWAAHQRVGRRITRDEHALWSELWSMHMGQELPAPKRYLGIQHWIPEESAISRLKPASEKETGIQGLQEFGRQKTGGGSQETGDV